MKLIKKLLTDLVSFRTITPHGENAIDYCVAFLQNLGFVCQKLVFGNVANLYAKLGNTERNLCFAGHVDVVPPLDGWSSDPFILTERDGMLFGRGVNDMKGTLASCLAAISEFLEAKRPEFSLSVMLTSDEEIMGDNGTKRVVDFLKSRGEKIAGCVLCESCSPGASGEYIKIGCRGSLNVDFTSTGTQCHVVSGKLHGNHLHDFVDFLSRFAKTGLDHGNVNFAPSDIEMTSIDAGNGVRNIIPAVSTAKFNIRFNDEWTFERLEQFIRDATPSNVSVLFECFGYPFIGSNAEFVEFLAKAMRGVIGKAPEIGTAGGNSDALSIHDITNVVEIGTPIAGAHVVNECIPSADLLKLKRIYLSVMQSF
jgi:succinyl-diaminopimelate desuccinylase